MQNIDEILIINVRNTRYSNAVRIALGARYNNNNKFSTKIFLAEE